MINLPFGLKLLNPGEALEFDNKLLVSEHNSREFDRMSKEKDKLRIDIAACNSAYDELCQREERLKEELEEKELIITRHVEILRQRNTVIRELTLKIYELEDEKADVDSINWNIRAILERIKCSTYRDFLSSEVSIFESQKSEIRTERAEASSDRQDNPD